MTVSEFVDYVRNRHNAVSDTFWADSEIYALIEARANEVLSIIGLIEAKDTSLTTTASTQAYNLPTNWVFIKKLLVDNYACQQITFDEWDAEHTRGSTDPTGTPDRYFLWNDQINLVPVPATSSLTITLYGYKKQSSITSASDMINIPSILHGRLCDGVIADMFAKDQKWQPHRTYEEKWLQVHIPAFKEYKAKRHTAGGFNVTYDTDPLY